MLVQIVLLFLLLLLPSVFPGMIYHYHFLDNAFASLTLASSGAVALGMIVRLAIRDAHRLRTFATEVLCKLLNITTPRCGEEKDLACWLYLPRHCEHILLKAQIQHSICLIKNKVRDLAQRQNVCAHKVAQSPWCCNHDVCTPPQFLLLRPLVTTSIETDRVYAGMAQTGLPFKYLVGFFCNLHRQLSCWSQHQNNWRRAALRAFFVMDVLFEVYSCWNQECQGLATASLGQSNHVTPRKHQWQGLCLYWHGRMNPILRQALEDVRRQRAELLKATNWVWAVAIWILLDAYLQAFPMP
mmetsp:Transcript_84037/g.158200  ORF Transcript_84037/g.158200 Transcript_84037/m.158200 type:complete len:298 (+) Transcript_84037:586-1479(+)